MYAKPKHVVGVAGYVQRSIVICQLQTMIDHQSSPTCVSNSILSPTAKPNSHKPPSIKSEVKPLPATKGKNKHTRQDIYADEAKKENEMLGKITEQKHKQWLLELQAQEHQLEAEEHLSQADHQHAQECEQHELWVLQFCPVSS